MIRRIIFLLTVLLLVLCIDPAKAQQAASARSTKIPVALRFSALEANAPPGSCGCFWLSGGAADTTIPLLPRLSAAVEVGGETAANVPDTTRGLSEITLLAGPRYTLPLGRVSGGRVSVAGQALFGAVHGFDADFFTGSAHAQTATAFAMALGGFVEMPLTHALSLRAVQVDMLQTNLPNGAGDRQRNLRIGGGIVFHVGLPSAR